MGFVMFFVEGAPFSFEIEHVEIIIALEMVDQPRFKVSLGMRERAKVSILTLRDMFRVLGTVSCFVFFEMVESFDTVMRKNAFIFGRAFISFGIFA